MNIFQFSAIFMIWVVLAGFGWRVMKGAVSHIRFRERLFEGNESLERTSEPRSHRGRLGLWLYGAGYESSYAVLYFWIAVLVFLFAGAVTTAWLYRASWLPWIADGLAEIPGNIGQIFIPLFYLAPFLLFLIVASLPWVFIAGRRSRRSEQVEEELPVFLEYFVTLSEAGLGFDEAMGRVLEVKKAASPLADAFRKFRKEVLAGSNRLAAYWRMRDRLQTPSIRTLVSALIQSEQAGGSIAGILRQQAADSLTRRRMKAMEIAYTLPVRLLFPMMCCFLPGLMAVLLGPLLFRMVQAVDSITRSIRG